MKKREDQILEIIKQDKMISQQDIADMLNINRSSVGVYINMLSKKGKILGRGYVLPEDKKITVIGGSNMDVIGYASEKLRHSDSNMGRIAASAGGVGRNIAENLARMGIKTEFITALGKDTFGRAIYENALKAGIKMNQNVFYENEDTSTYMALLDEDKELYMALNDSEVMKRITVDVINNEYFNIENSELIVLDTNLSQDTIDYIIQNFDNKRILVDPVSIPKAARIKKHLSSLYLVKPNIYELEVLADMEIKDKDDLKKAGQKLVDEGVENVVVTNGKDGAYYFGRKESFKMDAVKCDIENVTGAGDAFFSGLVYGTFHGLDIHETMEISTYAAVITLESELANSPCFNIRNIYRRMGRE